MTGGPMRVAIAGATGLIGTALARALREHGDTVLTVSRREPAEVVWDPARRRIDAAALEGLDAVFNLVGESIAGGRWTESRKALLRSSRIDVTRWLAETLASLGHPPGTFISASGINIYGNRGDELLDERASPGTDFLARVAVDWEAAADPARRRGIRVVHPRFAMVLSAEGGAMAKLLPPFRLGIGGPFGSGQQWMSWMAIDDVVAALRHVLASEVRGGVNITAPDPVRNADFARTLGRALHRPALIPVPAFALELAFGEMARETVLSSQRAVPAVLSASGFTPRFPTLDEAFGHVLGAAAP